MSEKDVPTLTLDALRKMAAQFKPLPRLIVGMPIVKDDAAWKRESDGMLFVGRGAWRSVIKSLPPQRTPSPFLGEDSLLGMRVEYFGDRPDHYTILRELSYLLVAGELLRIALDEEFGNTKPLL